MNKNWLLFGFFLSILGAFSCQKEELLTDRGAYLSFSTDTVYFDTVLTTLGSVTQRFKVYNDHDQPIKISKLYLANGESSFFRLNVDGAKGETHYNITIPSKDSLYIFSEVTIDPLDSSNPLLVKDSIIFITNENIQDIKLLAYGQDVNIFRNKLIESQTWTAEKPYLIIDGVAVDSNETLTIGPGCRIFMHNSSSLEIRGKINAVGTLDQPIIFSGDRFDNRYENAAGQWGALAISPSSQGNVLEYVIIKNAAAGLQVGSPTDNANPQVELRNCMITNSAAVGIYAFGATIDAYNTIVADCGQVALLLQMGGEYNFYHCTVNNISAYYPGTVEDDYKKGRQTPSLYFSNIFKWYSLDGDYRLVNTTFLKDLNVNFYNSILYGTLEQEIAFQDTTASAFKYKFDHCILKNHKDSLDYTNPDFFNEIKLNTDPQFTNDSLTKGPYDFHLLSSSPAIDSGSAALMQNIPQLELDFDGSPRLIDGKPDIGAYEFH